MSETTDLVRRSLSEETRREFHARVSEQASQLRTAIADGAFDNPDFAVGLELEVYAVSNETAAAGELTPLAEGVFESVANKELGLHNAEINTDPDVLDGDGVSAQAASITERFAASQRAARDHGCRLVPDAMWALPPAIGSDAYLTHRETDNGVTIADHMRPDPRYVAIDNEVLDLAGGEIDFTVPGVDRSFPSILFESLATSIQPHLQVPRASQFPAYYNTAIRTLGPVLAISANSPFLPHDLYTDVADPAQLIDRTHHELRIAVFEQSVNQSPNAKVRVPVDIDRAAETVDAVVADDLYAPFLREWTTDEERDAFAEDIWEFRYKRSTYWRWLRCVVGGTPVGDGDERSLRIEYRPIPTQPTVQDVVGMQLLTVGLIRGLVATDHPLSDLPWDAARRSFYRAAESGLDADLAWITADGERTDDTETVYDEVFEYARVGLRESDVPAAEIERYLAPIESRWTERTTPSAWKKTRVREALEDGTSLSAAIESMQREYIERSRESASFAEWI